MPSVNQPFAESAMENPRKIFWLNGSSSLHKTTIKLAIALSVIACHHRCRSEVNSNLRREPFCSRPAFLCYLWAEEYGETAPFQYFVSHEDPLLVAAVRQGRRNEFARFGWTGDVPDPEDESTFQRCKLNWGLQTASHHRLLWHFYRELLRLRREVPALAQLDKNAFEVLSFADSKVLLVERGIAPSQVRIVCHFDQNPARSSPCQSRQDAGAGGSIRLRSDGVTRGTRALATFSRAARCGFP